MSEQKIVIQQNLGRAQGYQTLLPKSYSNTIGNYLTNYSKYCWLRCTYSVLYAEIYQSFNRITFNADVVVQLSSTITIDQKTGEISLESPEEYTIRVSNTYSDRETYAKALQAKIPFYLQHNGNIYYVGDGAYCLPESDGYCAVAFASRYTYICPSVTYGSPATQVISSKKIEQGNDYQYLYSSEENAYPKNVVADGYMYWFLGIPFEKIPSGASITYGSYLGTGELRSESSPHILTFPFNPVFVMLTYVNSDNSSTQYLFYPLNRGSIYSYGRSSQQYYLIVNWGDRKISWYENYTVRFNKKGIEYNYIAIGY